MSKQRIIFFVAVIVLAGLLLSAGCSLSPRTGLDPFSQTFLDYASLIMTHQEKAIFHHLPDAESRREFIEDFWAKRDSDPSTEFNEFQEEFFRRIEYSNERFREGIPGWKTDRGRIYVFFGEPDQRELRPMVDNPSLRGYKGYIIWKYYRYGFAVMFVDKRGDGAYTFEPYVGALGEGGGIVGDFFEAMQRVQFGLPPKSTRFDKKYLDFDLEYDRNAREFKILIPADSVTFASEQGLLRAEFDVQFIFYRRKSPEKKIFRESRLFEKTEEEAVRLEDIELSFVFEGLSAGKYYVDVIIYGESEVGKARKIFNITY